MSILSDIQSIDELDLENQRVLLRADLDAPLTKGGAWLDDTCIRAAVPTIKKLQAAGAQVLVASRFGDARRDASKKAPSIEPAAARLGELLETDILLPDACTGDSVKKVLTEMRSSQVCVLENLALDADCETDAEAFARRLLDHADVFVADSLRVLSQASATTTILPRLMEHRAAGVSLMRELSAAARVQSKIDPPRLVIWGGNSLSQRLDTLRALVDERTRVALVGVAANTMLRALGNGMGRSALEESYLAGARTLAEQLGERLVLPVDLRVATSPRDTEFTDRPVDELREREMALDLGPRSLAQLERLVSTSRTIIWCGTAGFHKSETFAQGTRRICELLAVADAFTLVAGDDSVAATHSVGGPELASRIDCVSLGSETTLSLLKDNQLPGLSALRGPNG